MMERKELTTKVLQYINDYAEEQAYDFDEAFEDKFSGTPQYPDDITYEVGELLDYLGLPFNVLPAGKDGDYYVEVFAHIKYINKWLLLDNSKDIDEFTFDTVDELIDWIDKIQEDFLSIQEEIKNHFIS